MHELLLALSDRGIETIVAGVIVMVALLAIVVLTWIIRRT